MGGRGVSCCAKRVKLWYAIIRSGMKEYWRAWALTAVLAFVAIVVFMACVFLQRVDTKRSSGCGHGDSADGETCRIANLYVPPADDELEAYLRIIQGVANAYSNCQIEAMFESMRQLPSRAYQFRGEDLLKLEIPINRIWREDWILNKGVKDFASEEEFDRQMKKSLAIAKLYGEFTVASRAVPSKILVTIDCVVLKRLQTYRDEFERGGKADCLRSAERLLADWVEQIESENGFTRTYLRTQKIALRYFVKTGELSEEKLAQYVRDYVRPLQDRCDYTPKWLDVEFPAAPSIPH